MDVVKRGRSASRRPVGHGPADRLSGPARRGPAAWLGWGGLAVAALLGVASAGVSGGLVLAGLYVLLIAATALLRGHVRWARVRNRFGGVLAAVTAFALLIAGGAVAEPPVDEPAAVPSTPSATPAPSPAPSPTASATPSPTPTAPSPEPREPARGTALAAVGKLKVKGRAPKTGYSRDAFGQSWFDTDRNGCDTRNDILRRDLVDTEMKNYCKVLAGTLDPDPYTGTAIRFQFGGRSEVDIDHVVALSDAWQKGAGRWPAEKRLAFANDPLNLLAVDAGANRSKGDGDTATWLPSNKPYRCPYVTRQIAVKKKYGVWVTVAERDAMVRVLSACAGTAELTPGPAPTTAALPRRRTRQTPKPDAPGGVYYENCTAVRAAGAAPIRAGEPGYSRKLDRDGDGIACE